MFRRIALILLLLIPSLIGIAVFGYFALLDWGQLQVAYSKYAAVSRGGGGLTAITVAFNAQSIHRTNLFAEGVWTLLAAILAGIGVHGLCALPTTDRKDQRS